jgi:hypothetical protein
VGGVVLYHRVNRQAVAMETAATEEVLAAYRLVRTASAAEDREVIHTLLTGLDGRWVEAQRQLLAKDLLFDRAPFGLRLLPEAEMGLALADVSVTLAPNLATAEVAFDQPYAVDTAEDAGETVTLQQTMIFRRDGHHWVLAPPEPAFWGEWRINRGPILTVIYPARDHDIVQRLTLNLRDRLRVVCGRLANIYCPGDLHITLWLEKDPASLARLAGPAVERLANQEVVLPTPTLVGVPIDEAGYQALFHGYAAWLLQEPLAFSR